ncbi:hypothetical protein J2785_007473 [Burkholderia ambifaria]|nr:hypothetical protein [Burkholderia ambifaria]
MKLLLHFANQYWRGIVSRVHWPMHTRQLEGINNRIKFMKRMAYGYRDSAYFFLKIKAAYPGNPCRTKNFDANGGILSPLRLY